MAIMACILGVVLFSSVVQTINGFGYAVVGTPRWCDRCLLRDSAYMLPGVIAGVWLGEKVFHQINAQMFRWVTVAIVFFCGVMSVGSELIKLMHI